MRTPGRGEIWHVSLDPASGHEMRGDHFVLVLSHALFTQKSGMVFAAPITSGGEFARERGFCATLQGSGCRTSGAVVVSQVKMFDMKSRKGRFVEVVPTVIVDDVVARLLPVFSDD